MTLLDARSIVIAPEVEPELPRCYSCGKPASVRRWYATPDNKPELLCGRCANLSMGDTVGTIGVVLFDLGAAHD